MDNEIEITIEIMDEVSGEHGIYPVSSAYRVEPFNIIFEKNVIIIIEYNSELLTTDYSMDSLKIFQKQEVGKNWNPLESSINEQELNVTSLTKSSGYFQVGFKLENNISESSGCSCSMLY